MQPTQIDIRFNCRDLVLAGTLHLPAEKTDPALVMLQGSGPMDRDNAGYFVSIRDHFVQQGVAVLCFDRPGIGESTGDWRLHSFADRAEEALAAINCLSQEAGLNIRHAGLWGHSQGGWIAPLAAMRSQDVAFVICNSGPGVSLAEQTLYEKEQQMRRDGWAETQIAHALAFAHQLYAVEASAPYDNYQQVSQLFQAIRSQPWNAYFPPYSAHAWQFQQRIAGYNPVPVLEQVTCPLLAIFGELDTFVPVQKSVEVFEQALTQAGNQDFTLKVFAQANHRICIGTPPVFAPDYLDTMSDWIHSRFGRKNTTTD